MRAREALPQAFTEEDWRQVEASLSKILASRAFAPSPRSREFLEFVVRYAARTEAPPLTERHIAAEVFGKTTSFNPSEDSVVRVKASEVRKRLSAYYSSEGASDHVRIDLPYGSYSPEFQVGAAEPESVTAPAGWSKRWIAGSALGVIALLGLIVKLMTGSSVEDRFWGPVLNGPTPVVLSVPFRVGVRLADDTAMRLGEAGAPPPGAGLRIPLIGMGDSLGLARMVALCGRREVPYQIKISNDLTFADFRQQPAIVLGARWSRDIGRELRFSIVSSPPRIVDRSDPSRNWARVNLQSGEGPGEDYAIVARLRTWNGGQPVVIAAGMSTFGTQAAAEFLTSPGSIEELVRHAPAGWEDRNLEAVIHTTVVGKTPGQPKLIAVHCW